MPDILHVTVKGVTYDVPAVGGGAVSSVNGQTGNVVLDADDVGALPDNTVIPSKTSDLTNDSGFITGYTETDPTVPAWAKASSKPSYTAQEVGALPNTTVIPTKVSDLQNDSGFITGYTETDPTVPSWAKAGTKPSYTAQEVGAMPAVDDVTLEDDATNGGIISLYDTNDTLRQKLDGNGKLWQYDGSGNERTYLEYGDIYLKDANDVTRQHLDSAGTLEQFDSSAVKRTRLAWGDLYLYDGTGAQTFHADDAGVVTLGASGGQQSSISKTGITLTDANGRARISQYGSSGGIWLHKAADLNTSVFIQDTSDVTRTRLSKDGLSFFNSSGTKTAEYAAGGPMNWTSSPTLSASSFSLQGCTGTIANVAMNLDIDESNRIFRISGRLRVNNFARTGPNPGFLLTAYSFPTNQAQSIQAGIVCNQNGVIPTEIVYLRLETTGSFYIRSTESANNCSGTAITFIVPQTFFKY